MAAGLSLTIRERLTGQRMRRYALAVLATIAVFTWLGPFGTATRFGPVELFVYWSVNIGVNWGIAMGVVPRLRIALERKGLPPWAGMIIGALVSAVPGTGFVFALEWLIDDSPGSLTFLAYLYSCVSVVYLTLGYLAYQLIEVPLRKGPRQDVADPALHVPVPFLSRLPPQLGHDLCHLQMRDHYVEVHTTKGTDLILLRFRDALREVKGLDGMQVHRSHWVARAAVARSLRRNGRVFLQLRDGTEIPVSRSFVPALTEKGWL